jgi:hypothetical protein
MKEKLENNPHQLFTRGIMCSCRHSIYDHHFVIREPTAPNEFRFTPSCVHCLLCMTFKQMTNFEFVQWMNETYGQ